MVALELIRVVTLADISTIAETNADILLAVDRDTTVAAVTCPFPANPIRGQLMGISTRIQITALTLDAGPNAYPIAGYSGPFTLNANTVFWRIFLPDGDSNRWFPY